MSVPSLVDELIQLAQAEDTPLPELLRRTRVLATKLRIPELEFWVKKETSGYTGQPTDLPTYRQIPCELRARNLVHGWVPVVIEEENETADHFRTVLVHQSVAEIETLLESGNGSLMANVAPGEHAALARAVPQLARTQVARVFGKASLKGVLESIRSRVLEAALELDAKGIRGEGLSFSDEEKAKAAAVTTNIVNNIYGDNANIASAAHSPNSGAAFASGSAIINQHIGNIQPGNQELANAFRSVIEALKIDTALEPAKRTEAEQQLTFLAEQAAKPAQQRQPLAVLKSIFSGISQVAVLSANLTKVWEAFGPVIAGYLGS